MSIAAKDLTVNKKLSIIQASIKRIEHLQLSLLGIFANKAMLSDVQCSVIMNMGLYHFRKLVREGRFPKADPDTKGWAFADCQHYMNKKYAEHVEIARKNFGKKNVEDSKC